jgi:UDP-N-acetylglucosamine 2-epimerase (non-hydrolysing)
LTILCVLGTRPEAIKMAPVIRALRAHSQSARVDVRVLSTSQHDDVLVSALYDRQIEADHTLGFQADLPLEENLARMLPAIGYTIRRRSPDLVLVQGDTISALAGAQAAFLAGVPVGHVEAGLRTSNRWSPFPEEMIRRLISRIATLHFAPTLHAVRNLRAERVNLQTVFLTGNTVVDELKRCVLGEVPYVPGQVCLVTCHRREWQAQRIEALTEAIARLDARIRGPFTVIWPVHPNHEIADVVKKNLGNAKRVKITEPLSYSTFLPLLRRADLVITDSGGVIEEATTFNRSLIIVREETERPEALKPLHHRAYLIPLRRMIHLPDLAASVLVAKPRAPEPLSRIFGDGTAGVKIADTIMKWGV